MILIVGDTGSGKSWSAIKIAEIVNKLYPTINPFSVKDIIFTPKSFITRFQERQAESDEGVGSILIADEAGQILNARSSQSTSSKVLSEIFEMLRFSRINVFFTVPSIAMIDINLRRMFHLILFAQNIDRRNCAPWMRSKSTVRVYKVQRGNTPSEREQDFRTMHPIIKVPVTNSLGQQYVKDCRVSQIWLDKADEKTLLLPYEAKKKAYFKSFLNNALHTLERSEKKTQGNGGYSENINNPATLPMPQTREREGNNAILSRVRGRIVS